MALFSNTQGRLSELPGERFQSEKEMQKLVESNLEPLLGLQFVATEFAPRGDLRIDTLAYDAEQKSFVIIEYKKGSSWSVMDQGYSYLSLLLDRKADFVLIAKEKIDSNLAVNDIDWGASRVVFIAPSFTTYQLGALGFHDIAFDLYKIEQYGHIIALEQIQAPHTIAKIADVRPSSEAAQRVQREVKPSSIDDHFKPGWEMSRELFDDLVSRLVELDSRLAPRAVKSYIGISIGKKNIFSVHARQTGLVFHITRFKPDELKDPEGKLKYMENSKKYYNVHITEMRIGDKADVDYAMMIARQVLAKY